MTGLAVAFFTFLAFTTACTAAMNGFRSAGLLRELPRTNFQPALGLSRDAVLTVVGAAFIGTVPLVGVLTATRASARFACGIGIGVGFALTAAIAVVGFGFWELLDMLPAWWAAGGVLGGLLSTVRRRIES